MSFANAAISDIIATTIQSRSGVIADNVTDNNGLLAKLRSRGNVKTVSGGSSILQELSFQENPNASWYSGYDPLPVGAADVISAAEYDFKQAAVPVAMSGLEMLQNSGKEQIIDLMEGRMSVAESTLANLIAAALYSDGSGFGGKQLTGLAVAVAATGSYGGIDRGTWPFWKSQIFTGAGLGGATTAANIQAHWNTVYASTVRGGDHTDLIVCDNVYWGMLLGSMQAMQRFTSAEMARLGFTSIQFQQADVVLDGGIGGNAPASTAYFLNTKYIFFRPHRERNFVPLDPSKRYAVNQDAVVQLIGFAGNLTMSGGQFQAKVSG